MDKTLERWVYTAPIDQIVDRFNHANGSDKDKLIDAIRAVALNFHDDNRDRQWELLKAFPNMRNWQNEADRRFKSEMRKDAVFSILKMFAAAIILGTTLYSLRAFGFTIGFLENDRLYYGMMAVSVLLSCLGLFLRSEELMDGRPPANPTFTETIGQWSSIGGMTVFALALALLSIQMIWSV